MSETKTEIMNLMDVYRAAPEATFHGVNGHRVEIAAAGGGTLGKSYNGAWFINVYEGAELKASTCFYESGNHLEVALAHDAGYGYLTD